MSCARTNQMLDAWIDGELDAETSVALGKHAAECATCRAARADRVALIQQVRGHATHFASPLTLRKRIDAVLWTPPRSGNTQRPLIRSWWQVGALIGMTSLASVLLTVLWLNAPVPTASPMGVDMFVAQHVSSLRDPRHRIEVVSSDRHTVKPWFQGKLDFAPTVMDLTNEGFRLEGGRIDRLGDTNAAVLVYRLREHPVSLFMTRSTKSSAIKTSVASGFSLAEWATGGVQFTIVADTDIGEVQRLAGLISRAAN